MDYSKWYHGSTKEFSKFDVNFLETGNGNSDFGFGLYFSSSPEDARGYGSYLYEIDLAWGFRPASTKEGSKASTENLISLIERAEDWEATCQNWNENPLVGMYTAAKSAIRYNNTEWDMYSQIGYDFFKQNLPEYCRALASIGIDGAFVKRSHATFLVLVNTSKIISMEKLYANV